MCHQIAEAWCAELRITHTQRIERESRCLDRSVRNHEGTSRTQRQLSKLTVHDQIQTRNSTAGSAKAQVLTVTYFGHDASIIVMLDAGAQRVTTRVAGHMAPQHGAQVSLSVEGRVMAYPRIPPPIQVERSVTPASAGSRALPKGAFVQSIKEKQE